MAASGTIQQAIRTGYRLQVVWTVTGQSVANNTSTVTVKVQLVSTGSSYTINSSASKSGSLTINGTKYSFTFTAALSGNQTKTIYTKTGVTVAHNADGTKTCAFSATAGINVTLSGTYYGNVTASGNGTFDTIARATTPTVSASSVDMGASITINMPRASSGFDHTLTYKFGSATGTIGSDLGTSKAWTVPLSLASQIPNSTSGTCTITCKTYNGNTLVGTKTVTFTAKVPSSVVPTISSVAVADTNSAYATQFGSLVQNKSKAKFTITAAGAYGSTIKSYKTVIESKTYTGATPTTAVLTGSGNVTAKITVTDSRGRTATVDKTFNRLAYTAPKITAFDAFRSDSAGVANYEGTNANIAVNFSIASVGNKNTNTYKIERKAKTATAWTVVEEGNSYAVNKSIVTGAIFGVDSSFELRLTISDYFGSVSKIIELPTAFTLLDFNASGRAVAFGKVSEIDNAVEFALPVYFRNGETPSSVKYLETGQDLNDVLTEGFYAIPTTAISGTILNKPWTSTATGSLIVLREGNGLQKMQIIHKGSKDDGAIYERSYYQGEWGAWNVVHAGESKILWTGGYYMTETHKINLSEAVTAQRSGIVLVFSKYTNGAAEDTSFNSFFVPKALIDIKRGYGHTFIMAMGNGFGTVASKYLYINDEYITGHTNNSATGTAASGITYANNQFVLRYVIGV